MAYLHGRDETVKVLNLSTEEKVAELSKSKEDYEEHDGEASKIFGAAREGRGQLCHCLVEADVLENLDPGTENHHSQRIIETHLSIAEEVEVSKHIWILKQFREQAIYGKRTVDIVSNTANGDDNDNDIKNVPETFEIFELVLLYLF